MEENKEIIPSEELKEEVTAEIITTSEVIRSGYAQIVEDEKPELTPEDIAKLDKQHNEALLEFVNNKDNQYLAHKLADQFNGITKGNWFTLDKVLSKTQEAGETENSILAKLQNLIIFDMCVAKKVPGTNSTQFKITIKKEFKIKYLEDTISEMEGEIRMYKREIERLKGDIEVK